MREPDELSLFAQRLEAIGAPYMVTGATAAILRKLEFFREGGSTRHVADIDAIRTVTGVDEASMKPWLVQLGLVDTWEKIVTGRG